MNGEPWERWEIKLLRKCYGNPDYPVSEIADMLERTDKAIRSKAKVLHLGKDRRYSAADLDLVRQLYATHTAAQIGDRLGRSESSVFQCATRLGLR